MFDPVAKSGLEKYAQVLHIPQAQHWVAVTNVGAEFSKVRYFDSLNMDIPHSIKCAIASRSNNISSKPSM